MISFVRCLALAVLAITVAGCASRPPDRHPPPRYIELHEEPSISTFHFPRGVYVYESSDASGYYYRAPRQVMKHAFAGSLPYDGGIWLSRNDHRRLRAYVIWAGGRTKIGNLSGSEHEFHD